MIVIIVHPFQAILNWEKMMYIGNYLKMVINISQRIPNIKIIIMLPLFYFRHFPIFFTQKSCINEFHKLANTHTHR
jgi:hypothetical protein